MKITHRNDDNGKYTLFTDNGRTEICPVWRVAAGFQTGKFGGQFYEAPTMKALKILVERVLSTKALNLEAELKVVRTRAKGAGQRWEILGDSKSYGTIIKLQKSLGFCFEPSEDLIPDAADACDASILSYDFDALVDEAKQLILRSV